MNKATSQVQQFEKITLNAAQSKPETRQKAAVAAQSDRDSSGNDSSSNNASDSLWSNIKYGLGMLAVIIIPPLIPGASVPLLIKGYMLLIVGIYTVAAIVVAMRALDPTKSAKRGMHRVFHD